MFYHHSFHFKYTEKLLVNSNYHYSYTNQEFNDKNEETITIFSSFVEPQIKGIHHPALLQEWKLSIDAAELKIYEV